MMMDSKDQMMMSGGGAFVSTQYKKMKGAIKGYKDVTVDGEVHRIYGMTKKEYMDWYNNRTRSSRIHPVASTKRSAPVPQLRRSARIRERDEKRRASMGGKRKNNKSKKTRKARK
jgi:hypothetical protein